MKLVCVSDTHMFEPPLPDGDVLIHAGDLTFRGRPHEISQQKIWLAKQVKNYKHVIVVPGNHDFGFESNYKQYMEEFKQYGITVLNDTGLVIDGINFWGSPITPYFHNWAFNKHEEAIVPYWDAIPDNTQVLITHGPPRDILDWVLDPNSKKMIGYDQYYRPMYKKTIDKSNRVGCKALSRRIRDLKDLKVHIFGHLHEAHGKEEHNGVIYVNASIMDEDYHPVNKPIVVEI